MARARGCQRSQVIATLSLVGPRLYLFIADRILMNEMIAHLTPCKTKPPNHHQRDLHDHMLGLRPHSPLLERINQIAHKLRRRRTALLSHLSKLGTATTIKTEGERLSANTDANRASGHRRTEMLPVVRNTGLGLVPPTLQILISERRTIS